MFYVGRIRFEWDEAKATANAEKHGVTFEEAATAFADPLATIFDDVEHSDAETREALIGRSRGGRLLITSFTMRNDRVRLISARMVKRNERKDYEEGRLS